MRRTVVAVFRSMNQVERALKTVELQGKANDEISVIVKNAPWIAQKYNAEYAEEVSGAVTQGLLHDFDSLLVQIPDLEVPHLGTVAVGGPLGGLLTEDDRTLAEALTFYGVSGQRGQELEDLVQKGHILVLVETNNAKASQVSNILADLGGREIEKWSKSIDKPLKPWNQGN